MFDINPDDIDRLNKILQGKYVRNVKNIIKSCAERRSLYRHFNNGFDRKKTVRVLAAIPFEEIAFDVERKKYFDNEAPDIERNKDLRNYLKKNPQYLLVDNLDWK